MFRVVLRVCNCLVCDKMPHLSTTYPIDIPAPCAYIGGWRPLAAPPPTNSEPHE